jgi:hypothetical protein
MNWYVVRHSETGGVGCVSKDSLALHKANGWLRVSDPLEPDAYAQFAPAVWADAPDLDAPEPEPDDPDAEADDASQPEPDDPAETEE